MSSGRLVDYFVVAGYDCSKRESGGLLGNTNLMCKGRVLQRFPAADWPDTPFIDGLELFCQPDGWRLSPERSSPKFFTLAFTDVQGSRHHCCVLAFSEAVSINSDSGDNTLIMDEEKYMGDEEAEVAVANFGNLGVIPGVSLPTLATHSDLLFAPKCLVLVSRHDRPQLLKKCLRTIYTAYSECLVDAVGERIRLETLIGNLLGHFNFNYNKSKTHLNNNSGSPSNEERFRRFSLGVNDRLVVCKSLYPEVPLTSERVCFLFNQLGIRNVLTLFTAAMTELKILFFSNSFNRLTDASSALVALMYPLKYPHVFIPVLPASLLEVLATPTPFIIGIRSALVDDVMGDLLDVIKVDLDGGAIIVPDNMSVLKLPTSMETKVISELSSVLQPDLGTADDAFENEERDLATSKEVMDKQLRAVMLRLMTSLLEGYRWCLMVVRIHPKPFITFHKASFLGKRNLHDCEFMLRFLDCMSFTAFVDERGTPWRELDLFDELIAHFEDYKRVEAEDPRKTSEHIQQVAQKLASNEKPLMAQSEKLPSPVKGAMNRIYQPVFPNLNEQLVQTIIDRAQSNLIRDEVQSLPSHKQTVPMGSSLTSNKNGASSSTLQANSARKLSVLRDCISAIFDNKISEAKKTLPAVISALKSSAQACNALCEELQVHKTGNQVILDQHHQFDMIVRLMNAALKDDLDLDVHGIALALLPLSTAFGRKLAKGVVQFVYTLIQDHGVWQNQQFWEACFYHDVQEGIRSLYNNNNDSSSTSTTLEMAAEELRLWETLTSNEQRERIEAEEKTVYSQVFVYINYMISLLSPLEWSKGIGKGQNSRRLNEPDIENISNSVSNSVGESDSIDGESGFEEQVINDSSQQVIKAVMRFADKVCSESSVSEDHTRSLNAMVPTTVAMHMEDIDGVCTEVKRLPPIQKAKIVKPSLLNGEEFVIHQGLRVYLLKDGREDVNGRPGVQLLPAEGALFLTNYRVIFKGHPIDPLATENVVTRFFPASSITKEKRFTINQYLSEIEQQLKEGLQLRSCTFQMIKVAFDEEVSSENVDHFRRTLQRVQHPEHVFQLFAFRAIHNSFSDNDEHRQHHPKHHKYLTIRGLASKTLRNVGKVYYSNKKHKNMRFLMSSTNNGSSPSGRHFSELSQMKIREEDESSEVNDDTSSISSHRLSSATQFTSSQYVLHSQQSSSSNVSRSLTLERLCDSYCMQDWRRLDLISSDYSLKNSNNSSHHVTEQFRVSSMNLSYTSVPSYPSLLLVPARVSDESLRRYARCHKHSRFPTITWRHKRNHALLLRGSGFQSRGVLGLIRRHQQDSSNSSNNAETSNNSNSLDAELYAASIVSLTPRALLRQEALFKRTGSQLSINSLVIKQASLPRNGNDQVLHPTLNSRGTVGIVKTSPFSRAVDTLTRSTNTRFNQKPIQPYQQSQTHQPRSSSISSSSVHQQSSYNGTVRDGSFLQHAALYILADKSQLKGGRVESGGKTEVISVEVSDSRRIRSAFKKLTRACLPTVGSGATTSTSASSSEKGFLREVESSEWLQLISQLLQVSGVVVDLLDVQGASVVLALEDGWDATPQISSLALLCLDPFYRTLHGFRMLIEKEWLSAGHRFGYRLNLTEDSQDTGFTPIFLQFLDAVHQIQLQFPSAFEFNGFYLKFLAYHHTSARFKNFLFDSDCQRFELGLMDGDEKVSSLHGKKIVKAASVDSLQSYNSSDEDNNANVNDFGLNTITSTGDVFDFIEIHSSRDILFHNLTFDKEATEDLVFRPYVGVANLAIWDYYLSEDLKHGAPYELELLDIDLRNMESSSTSSSSMSSYKKRSGAVAKGYDCVDRQCLSFQARRLRQLRNISRVNWRHTWTHTRDSEVLRSLTIHHGLHPNLVNSNLNRILARSAHKLATMELILRGKLGHGSSFTSGVGGGSPVIESRKRETPETSTTHRFEKCAFSTPSSCEVCSTLLWGPVKTGVRCDDCGVSCHEKCRDHVNAICAVQNHNLVSNGIETKVPISDTKSASQESTDAEELRRGIVDRVNYKVRDVVISNSLSPRDDANSQILCQSYLFKQANFKLKGWKQRWFILDATKHQMRYFDTREDFQCKGFIDLSEVTRIALVDGAHVPNAVMMPNMKKASGEDSSKCFFDMHTTKRTYCFCADTAQAAADWVLNVQRCLST